MTSIEFGNRLADLRKEKGYSQDDLAEKLGVSRQAISKWERGEATPDTNNLIALASLYGVSLDTLVLDKPGKKEEAVEQEKEEKPAESPKEEGEEGPREKKIRKIETIVTTCLALAVTAVYVSLGVLYDSVFPDPWVWKLGWIFYLLIPACSSIFAFIRTKNYQTLTGLTTAASVFIYMILGMQLGYWHPGWVVFFLIPVSSAIFEAINKGTKK